MEGSEVDCDISDHAERCRLCLKMIGESDICYKVTEKTRERFEILTSYDLTLDRIFSPIMCASCNRDLSKLWSFRDNLIVIQKKLYDFVFSQVNDEQEIQQLEEDSIHDSDSEMTEYLHEDLSSEIQIDEVIETKEKEENEIYEDVEYIIADADDEVDQGVTPQKGNLLVVTSTLNTNNLIFRRNFEENITTESMELDKRDGNRFDKISQKIQN